MPLPNPKVLKALLNIYAHDMRHLNVKPKTMYDQVTTAFTNSVSTVIGGYTNSQLQTICENVFAKFNNKTTVQQWLEVANDLAVEALDAHNAKSSLAIAIHMTSPDSKLCNTLHAIRTYIIYIITQDELLKREYDAIINEENKSVAALEEKRIATLEEGNDAYNTFSQQNEKLVRLAYIGHFESTVRAAERNLFGLPCKNSKQGNIPYTLAHNYFEKFYEENLRFDITGATFSEWEHQTINKPDEPELNTFRSPTPNALNRRSPSSPLERGMFSARGSQESVSSKGSVKEGGPSSSSEEASSEVPPPPPGRPGASHSASQGDGDPS